MFPDMKIRYLSSHNALTEAVDRRRGFGAISHMEGIEVVQDMSFDLVFVGAGGDLARALELKRSKPSAGLIFDYANHYLEEETRLKAFLRPLLHSAFRGYAPYFYGYKALILELMSVADQVVCSSTYQQIYLKMLGIEASVITDIFDWEFDIPDQIEEKPAHQFIWEGKAFNLDALLKLEKVVNTFPDIPLSVLTDVKFGGYGSTQTLGKSVEEELNARFLNALYVSWTSSVLMEELARSTLGLLPINLASSIGKAKPENRLILLWRFGVPALTSPLPSYKDLADRTGVDFICTDDRAWIDRIKAFTEVSDQNLAQARFLKDYADAHYSETVILDKWRSVLAAVG
jgi:hypothetical protein